MPSPLAAKILKNLCLPVKKRRFRDETGILKELPGAQYFECTDLLPLYKSLARKNPTKLKDAPLLQFTILSAEKTWLEWIADTGRRTGVLLKSDQKDLMAGKLFFAEKRGSDLKASFDYSATPPKFCDLQDWFDKWLARGVGQQAIIDKGWMLLNEAYIISVFLSLIATPKITKRIIRSSLHGVSRRDRHGRWPSDDTWNEVKIYVDEAVHRDPTVIGPMTGSKALHHVRSHWRCRLGHWEPIRAHWRGDASLGIVRSRYKPTVRDAERAHHDH